MQNLERTTRGLPVAVNLIADPPGGSTAASPFECVRSWKERAVGISGVLGVPGVSGVRGVPGAFVMKHFGRNGN